MTTEPSPPEFDRLIASVARELKARRLPFMLIGGQAVLLHGEPRLTQDVDITLGVDPGAAEVILAVCESLGLHVLGDEPLAFARRTFVLPAAEPATRIRIDYIFSTTPYEQEAIRRAVHVEVAGVDVPYASAEDLILHKLFAGRARDLEDASGVVVRRAETLDWSYIERWAREFSVVEGRENLPELVRQMKVGSKG